MNLFSFLRSSFRLAPLSLSLSRSFSLSPSFPPTSLGVARSLRGKRLSNLARLEFGARSGRVRSARLFAVPSDSALAVASSRFVAPRSAWRNVFGPRPPRTSRSLDREARSALTQMFTTRFSPLRSIFLAFDPPAPFDRFVFADGTRRVVGFVSHLTVQTRRQRRTEDGAPTYRSLPD